MSSEGMRPINNIKVFEEKAQIDVLFFSRKIPGRVLRQLIFIGFFYKSTLCFVEYIKFFNKNSQNADTHYQLSASLCKNVKQQSTT